jgi:hypothetical protein
MYEAKSLRMRRRALTVASLLCLMVMGCAVHFVSDYDEVTDRMITDLQARTEAFVLKMADAAGTPAGTCDSNKVFYTEAKATILTMQSRAAVMPKNQTTVEQLKKLEENIGLMAELHEKAGDLGLIPEKSGPVLDMMDEQFRAIIQHELDKKRGK